MPAIVVSGRRRAEKILVLCTTASLPPTSRERLAQILAQPIDWAYLIELAGFHGIVPLVAHNLVSSDFSTQVPQLYLEKLKQSYNHTVYINLTISHELSTVLSVFNQHGIPSIPLKGTVLAEVLYGNFALRSIADTDILVHAADMPLARSLLAQLGYQQSVPEEPRQHPFHDEPYVKQRNVPVFLELHWALDDSRLAAIPEEDIWGRVQPLQLHGVSTLMLSPEDNLLFLANHLSKNDFNLLKLLGDIAQLLKKYEGQLDWDHIVKSAHSWEIEVPVYRALRQARDLLGAPVPVSRVKALRPGVWHYWLIEILVGRETLVSPVRWGKLRGETSTLARSLMVRGLRRKLIVLSKYRGLNKKGAWLRTTFWAVVVFVAALWRYGARAITASF